MTAVGVLRPRASGGLHDVECGGKTALLARFDDQPKGLRCRSGSVHDTRPATCAMRQLHSNRSQSKPEQRELLCLAVSKDTNHEIVRPVLRAVGDCRSIYRGVVPC